MNPPNARTMEIALRVASAKRVFAKMPVAAIVTALGPDYVEQRGVVRRPISATRMRTVTLDDAVSTKPVLMPARPMLTAQETKAATSALGSAKSRPNVTTMWIVWASESV